MSSELLTVSEAARRLKLSESFLNQARSAGGGPAYVRLGRAIRYRESDIDAWVAERGARSTSEYEGSASK